jgi:hypothetical protein
MAEREREAVAIRDLEEREAADPRESHTRAETQLTIYRRSYNARIASRRHMDTHFPWRPNLGRGLEFLGAMLFVLSLGYLFRPDPSIAPTDYAARTKHIMSTIPLIDGHNDMPYLIRIELKNHIYDKRFTFKEGLLSPTDLVKLRTGGVGGQFWSAFVPCVDDVTDDFNIPTVSYPTQNFMP